MKTNPFARLFAVLGVIVLLCVLIFGREPSLLAISEQRAWRRLALANGQLSSLDHMEIEIPESIPNLVPFPISARTAGVA